MNVLYVTQFLARSSQAGANRLWDTVQYLRQRGHSVRVLTSDVHYLEDRLSRISPFRSQTQFYDGIPVTSVYTVGSFRRSTLRRILNYCSFPLFAAWPALRAPRLDVVIASVQPIFAGVVGVLAAHLHRARFVLEVRDVWPDAIIALGMLRSNVLIGILRRVEMWLYHTADSIIALTPGIKRNLVAKGVPAERIEVIPNGFPDDLYAQPQDSRAARRELGVTSQFVVMYTGAFGRIDSLHVILEAARLLADYRDMRFVLVGDGDQAPALKSYVEQHHLDNVLFTGLKPRSSIPHLLAAADVCTMALPKGEFWHLFLENKFFDYLASGHPVVAAVAGDQADVLREAKAGIVVAPGDARALADALLRLYHNPRLRQEMGRRGRAYAYRHFKRGDLLRRHADAVERAGTAECRPCTAG